MIVDLQKLLSLFARFNVAIEQVFINDQDIELEIYPNDSMFAFEERSKIVHEMSKIYDDLDFDWIESHLLRISHHDFEDLEIV